MPKSQTERNKEWKSRQPKAYKACDRKKSQKYREKLKNTLTDEEEQVERLKRRDRKRRNRATLKEKRSQAKTTTTPPMRPQVKGRMMNRVREVLTGTEDQNKVVLKSLLDENSFEDHPTSCSTCKRLPETTIAKVKAFYLDGDISRASPNIKNFITIKEAGEKKKLSVKHLASDFVSVASVNGNGSSFNESS